MHFLLYVYKGEIAEHEVRKLQEALSDAPFASLLMDGSQDISGQEQETLYLRFSKNGLVKLKFLTIASPSSTTSKDLLSLVDDTFKTFKIDAGTAQTYFVLITATFKVFNCTP